MAQITAWLDQMIQEHCEACRLEQLPDFSPFVTVHRGGRWFDERETGEVCPVLPLTGSELAGCIPTAQTALFLSSGSRFSDGGYPGQ